MSRSLRQYLDIAECSPRCDAAAASPRWAKLPYVGRFCRAIYASLTIRRRRFLYSHGEITTMRIYGPNGTTLGSPASSTRRTSSTGFSLPEAPVDARGAALGRSTQGRRQHRCAARAAGRRGSDRAPQAFGRAGQGRARRARRAQDRAALRQSRCFHGEPAARCRGQSEILLRRSRPSIRCLSRSSCGLKSNWRKAGQF